MAADTKRKRIVWLLAGGVVVVVLVAVLALRKDAPAVVVVAVMREDLNQTITSNGKVEPIAPQVARAEFPAFVDKVMATEGQMVKRGQVILTLDAADIRSQLAQAKADELAAQTDLRNAHAGGPPDQVAQLRGNVEQSKLEISNLERTEKSLEQLVAKQAATQDELAQNQNALARARARLQELEQRKQDLAQLAAVGVESASLRLSQAQELVRALEDKVRSATVAAVADGALYSLPVHPGDYVKVGDDLADVADLNHVRVRAFVDEPDLGLLEPKQDVQVTWDAKAGRTWTGVTEQIPKQVVARGVRSVGEVLCSVDNSKLELLPNINVEVRILVRERHGAIVVPRGAVREDGARHFVYVVDGNTIHRRDITVGAASASEYEVVSGLAAGDRVAIPGDQDLRDGQEIRAAEGS